jgi:arylformamidase
LVRVIRDISIPLNSETDVWEGDNRFTVRRVMSKSSGCSVNVTTIETTVQIGTHVDAPLHFHEDGADIATVPLDPFIGRARVVRLHTDGAITRQALEGVDLDGVERLLVSTRSEPGQMRFADPFSYLEPAAAELLAERRVKLFGIDSFSVDDRDSKELLSHHALDRVGCSILEGLVLFDVPPGDYELIALPLPLVGCDGSPVRAVLRDLP